MKSLKKALSLVLAFVMVVGILPTTAWANEEPAEDIVQSSDGNDLFANGDYGWSGYTWNDGNGLSWNNSSEDTYGDSSSKAWKFGAAAGIASEVDYQVNLNGSYNMDGYYFVFNAKVSGVNSQLISVRPQSVAEDMPIDLTGYQTATLTTNWQTFMLDFSLLPWDAYHTYGLNDVQRVTILFDFDSTAGADREVTIDNVRLVKMETASEDWIHMSVDAGMSNAGYSYTDAMLKTEGSATSLRLDTANAKINYTVSPQWEFAEKKVDMTNGILSGYFHFGGGAVYAAAELVSDNWKYTGRMEFQLEDLGDGWYYGTLDTSKYDFSATDLAAGANKANTIRVRLYFRQNLIIHVDGLQYQDRTDRNDLFAGGTYVSGSSWTSGTNMTYENNCAETYGDGSFTSWKFSATAANNNQWAQFMMGMSQSYDMQNCYFVFDAKVEGVASQQLSIRPRSGADAAKDPCNNTVLSLKSGWNTYLVDFSAALKASSSAADLSDVQRIFMVFDFAASTGADRSVIIDNVRLVAKETVDADWIHAKIDAGMTDAAYSYTDKMLKADGSSLALRLDTAGAKIRYTLNTQAQFGSLDMTTGVLSGYFHFGEGEAYAAAELISKNWKETGRLVFNLKPVGDGWYYGTLNLANYDFSEELLAIGASKAETIRIRLYFRQNNIIHIDGLSFGELTECLHDNTNAVVTAPTFEANGYTTYTCTDCGESFVGDEVTAYAYDVPQWNIALADDIRANYFVTLDDRITEGKIQVTVASDTLSYSLNELSKNDNGQYEISVNLAAAQMTDDIAIQAVCDDVVSAAKTYSIRQYAEYILTNHYDDDTAALVKAMLNYGAAAQTYFGYNTAKLANAGYESENIAEIPAVDSSNMVSGRVSGISFYGASVVFESKIAVRFYFNVSGNVADYAFSVGSNPELKDGKYYVEVSAINPQDYGKEITLTVSSGDEAMTVTYSPLAYISRMYHKTANADLKNLLGALYGYHLTAEEYLAEDDVEIKEETVVNDWTNMSVDQGMSNATSYALSTEKTAPGSSQSLKFTTSSGNIGYVVLNSQSAVSSGDLEKLPDFTNGKITAWFYFGDQRPMAFLRPVDSTWTNGVSGSFEFEDKGNGWYLGSVSTSELQYDIRKTGQKINEIIRIAVEIPGGYTVYVDNMQWAPIAATLEMEQASDLLAISTIVEEYTTILPEISTDEISGIYSQNSWKFSATAGISEKKTIRYELPESYDMTHQALSLDVHRYDVNVTHGILLVSLQNSNGETVVDALVDNIYWQYWNHLEVDLYKYLEDGKSLADVKYITFTFYFDTHTEYDRYYYIDNVAITPYETYETELSGTSALYIGDSISIARPFKGWAGLLEERYGVERTNVSIGGYSLSTIGNQIKDQLQSVPAGSEFDYIILDGGINDVYLGATEYGEVSTTAITAPPSAFDDTTAIGAFEQLMSMLKRSYPTAKIGYVITYQRDARWTEQFVPEVIKACEKWGVSYLCLPATEVFNDMFNENAGAHTADTVHATVEGYELIMEYLPQWMEAIPEPEIIEGFAPEVYDQNDLFTNASYGWSGSTWNDGNGLTWTNKSADTCGEGSIKSWMFGADANVSSKIDYQVNLNGSYNMDGYYFVFDAKVSGANSQTISIRPQSVSDGSPIDLAGYQDATLTGSWQSFMLDFSKAPWDAYYTYGLNDVQRVTIRFNFDSTAGSDREVVIDNVRLVKKESVDADWINMSVDAGMSNAGYSYTDQMVKAEGSTMSLRLDTANAKINYTVSPQWQFAEKKVDMTNGILSGYFHFGEGGTAYAAAELVSDNWKYTGRMEFELEDLGDGWYYATLDTSKYNFSEADLAAGADKANTIRVRLYFRQNLIVHIDGLRFVDRTDYVDMFTGGSWVSGSQWATANNMTYESNCTETYGEASLSSWKFSASAANNNQWAQFMMGMSQSYDLSGYYLVFDAKVDGVDSQKLSIRPRTGTDGASDPCNNTVLELSAGWNTYTVDFAAALKASSSEEDLSVVQRIFLVFDFAANTGSDRSVIIDNVRLVKK